MSTIYIVSDNGKLLKKQEVIQHIASDGTVTKIFPYKTEQLVIMGNVEFTGPAIKMLMHYGIDTVLMNKNGRYNGKLAFQQRKNVFLRKRQFLLSDNANFKMKFAKAVVTGKLKNQLSFMQRIKRREREKVDIDINDTAQKMKKILEKIDCAENMEQIRGFEGIGARYFFKVFRYNIIQDWAVFNGRSMHPPKDNVNAVLSFLYTLLFYRIDGLLEAADIDPYVGYLHELSYGKQSLSFDLIEEYRTVIADTLCCALFNRGTLQEEDFRSVDFSPEDDEYPLAANIGDPDSMEAGASEKEKAVLLTKEGLRKVISQFEKKLETEVLYQPLNKRVTYKRVFREQINHFKRVLLGEEDMYKPLVMK